MASITPSGYAGLTDLIITVNTPIIKPYIHFPLLVWADVTGSVAIKTVPNKKLPIKRCCKGVIVNIASTYGLVGADQRIYGKSGLNLPISYAATKGAIVKFKRYLAAYWHGKNIRVNKLSPGGVLDKTYQNKKFIENYSKKTILGR